MNTKSLEKCEPAPKRLHRYLLLPLGLVAIIVGFGGVVLLLRHGKPLDPDAVWGQAQEQLHSEQIDAAESSLRRLTLLRKPTVLDWLLRAQVAMARSRTDEALDDLKQIKDDPKIGAQARLMMGQLELRRKRLRYAENYLLSALELDPKLVPAHRELIYIYGIQLRRRALNEQFHALAELTPLTYDNVFHWCLTRNSIWEPLELSQMMENFIKTDPDDRWSRISLAECLRTLGKKDEAEKVLGYLPDSDPDARVVRVRLALDRGDDKLAESLLADGPPDHAELARLRGRMALAHKDAASALKHFRLAMAVEPDNRDAIFGLSGALAMLGEKDEAEKYRKLAKDHDMLGSLMQRASTPTERNNPTLLQELGAACEAIHRLAEARSWYNLVITRDPLNKEAQQSIYRVNAAIAESQKRKSQG
ncbi:tetratricopeptide repeat protein [Singulisphaera sp. PoT]|uniref:tetratricopeptide repeat protein n=1 Tax=Singulisphaera sp. PoT TaxID=3411797 RepID=UPI003BF571C8